MSHPETIYNGLDYKLGPQNVVKPHTQLHLWNEIAYLGKLHLCKLKFASFYQPTLVKNNPIKARITIVSVTAWHILQDFFLRKTYRKLKFIRFALHQALNYTQPTLSHDCPLIQVSLLVSEMAKTGLEISINLTRLVHQIDCRSIMWTEGTAHQSMYVLFQSMLPHSLQIYCGASTESCLYLTI